jgi:hypothetical protein
MRKLKKPEDEHESREVSATELSIISKIILFLSCLFPSQTQAGHEQGTSKERRKGCGRVSTLVLILGRSRCKEPNMTV